MKTIRLLGTFVLLVLSSTLHAQWVSIPDNNFATYLNNYGYGQCMQGNNTIGWQLDTTCPAVTSALSIGCVNRNISNITGIEYFDSLTYLDVSQNNLTSLPVLPPLLHTIYLEYNHVSYLSILNDSLKYIFAKANNINSIGGLPANLEGINIEYNNLSAFPQLPDSLRGLLCSANPFSVIPALPPALEELHCDSLNLTTLPPLPNTLSILYCRYNALTTLPALPDYMNLLDCSYNQLDSLPILGGINWFFCNNNNLTYLPHLPYGMWKLNCSNNPLQTLDDLSDINLYELYARNCGLTTVGNLPTFLGTLDIGNNPQLTCLPPLHRVEHFIFDSTAITCLPNYPTNNVASYPALSNYPLCLYNNNTSCQTYWNITGHTYFDNNNNCVLNSADSAVENVKVLLVKNGNTQQQFIAGQGGSYSFDTDANYGAYQLKIDTANMPYRVKCPANGVLSGTITPADSLDTQQDFALECKPGVDLVAQGLVDINSFRPGSFNIVKLTAGDASAFYNLHCAAGTSGTVTLSFTGPVIYTSALPGSLVPVVNGNTLTWNIANFGTLAPNNFGIVMHTDTNAQAGQKVCFTLTVNTNTTDVNPANNTLIACRPVVNSCDPNDKAVYPDGNIDTTQRDLVYTIRFQNTGNAEAQHIYITDTLSSSINPASFQLLAYSHQPMVQLDGNKLRFNFPNINLPDSTTNEPASHGYVQFKVKLNNGLPVGTVINNTAFIYFDFNAPVVTNTTTNTIYVPAPPAIKPVSIGKYRIDRGVKPNGRL